MLLLLYLDPFHLPYQYLPLKVSHQILISIITTLAFIKKKHEQALISMNMFHLLEELFLIL